MIERIAAIAISAALTFGAGYWLANKHGKEASAKALAEAEAANRKHNDEVVNGWNLAVLDLRRRLRDGYAPRIPGGVPTTPDTPSGVDGGAADIISTARELGTCQQERQRLIEDCAMTTIQLQGLQTWAK